MSLAKEVNASNFQAEVLDSPVPVLVDFWAPWCGPCRMIGPMVDQVAAQFEGRAKVVKVDIDANPAIARQFHVRAIPMLLLFDKGQVAATQVGATSLGALSQMVSKAL